MANATNLITRILKGSFAPATAGNPRPHGMPPFYHLQTDADIANVATYIRSSGGSAAPVLTELDVVKYRNALKLRCSCYLFHLIQTAHSWVKIFSNLWVCSCVFGDWHGAIAADVAESGQIPRVTRQHLHWFLEE